MLLPLFFLLPSHIEYILYFARYSKDFLEQMNERNGDKHRRGPIVWQLSHVERQDWNLVPLASMCFAINWTSVCRRVEDEIHRCEFSNQRKLIYRALAYNRGHLSHLAWLAGTRRRRRNQVSSARVVPTHCLLRCHLQIPTLYEANRPQTQTHILVLRKYRESCGRSNVFSGWESKPLHLTLSSRIRDFHVLEHCIYSLLSRLWYRASASPRSLKFKRLVISSIGHFRNAIHLSWRKSSTLRRSFSNNHLIVLLNYG